MASTITERQRINTSSAVKVPCKAATTANVTLSGEQTIDGVSCTTGDRVLVKDQTTASENGIWLVDTSAWKRARDWDGAYDVKQGTFVYVTGGTSSGFWYVTTSTDPIIPGTTSVTIAQASSQLLTFSAFMQTLFDDADAAAFLTTLGVSAYIQTLLNDVDAGTARTTLGLGTAATNNTGTSGATVPLLNANNTHSGDNDIKDTMEIYDPADTTKKVRIDAGSVSTGTTRVVAVPDHDVTVGDAIVSGTVTTTTSGTSHDYIAIPSWVKRITLMFTGVSTNGTNIWLVQIGDSGGIETSGYGAATSVITSGVASVTSTAGFPIYSNAAAATVYGALHLKLLDSSTNTWECSGVLSRPDATATITVAGAKALTGALDRIRLTTNGGTDAFDAGSINILYE